MKRLGHRLEHEAWLDNQERDESEGHGMNGERRSTSQK